MMGSCDIISLRPYNYKLLSYRPQMCSLISHLFLSEKDAIFENYFPNLKFLLISLFSDHQGKENQQVCIRRGNQRGRICDHAPQG